MTTAKFDGFKAALIELCKAHGVQIGTSGYDALCVWDMPPGGSEPIYCDNIEDATKADDAPPARGKHKG